MSASDALDPAPVLVTPPPPAPLVTPAPIAGSDAVFEFSDEVADTPSRADPLRSDDGTTAPFALARASDRVASGSLLAVSADGRRLVAQPTPDDRTADGYLRITAKLLLESARQSFHTIGVISGRDGEGRTAAAVNLAVCLGRAKGRRGRVLLVDADARRRALTQMFCGAGDPRAADGSPLPHPSLIGTALECVDLMTAPLLDDRLTISSPLAWIDNLNDLAGSYPHVVVDCPAVLENPEGLVLRECVQKLVLVTRAGTTTRQAIQRTLGPLGSRVLGVILNGNARGAEASR